MTKDPFLDSYDLVCNINKGVAKHQDREKAIDEIYKLAIVRAMQSMKPEADLNFIYSNKNSVDNEPCLVLQTRYFRPACLEKGTSIKVEDIVQEVPASEYYKGGPVIKADETVFESKGMVNCKRSILFNTDISNRGGHVVKTKADQGQHKNGFELMQSKDDRKEGRELIDGILKHRIEQALSSIGCKCNCNTDKAALRADFFRLQMSDKKWLWPVHGDRHKIFGKIYEEYTATEYEPRLEDDSSYNLSSMWTTFAHEMGRESKQDKPKGRLDVFRSLSAKRAKSKREKIPHIKNSSNTKAISCSSEKIWKELLLGDDGPYKNALYMFQSSSDSRVRSTSGSSF
jgi:hypothetical protein